MKLQDRLITALLLGGVFYFLTDREVQDLKNLKVTPHTLGKIKIESGKLVIDKQIKLSNESNISVDIEKISFDVSVGGVAIGSGVSSSSFTLPANDSVVVPVVTSLSISASVIAVLMSVSDLNNSVKTKLFITLRGGKKIEFDL